MCTGSTRTMTRKEYLRVVQPAGSSGGHSRVHSSSVHSTGSVGGSP